MTEVISRESALEALRVVMLLMISETEGQVALIRKGNVDHFGPSADPSRASFATFHVQRMEALALVAQSLGLLAGIHGINTLDSLPKIAEREADRLRQLSDETLGIIGELVRFGMITCDGACDTEACPAKRARALYESNRQCQILAKRHTPHNPRAA